MSLSNPTITVLMPVYNGEKYLAEAIESILDQTYTDFEFLILDDCSTDKSHEIISSYKDKRIHFIKNEQNMGQSNTMNIGIKLSKGKFIARLDQDDLSCKTRLDNQLYFISKSVCSIVGTWAYAIDQDGEIIGYVQHPTDHDIIKNALAINPTFSHSSVMFNKDDIISLGCYSSRFTIGMDWHLWIKAGKSGLIFGNIDEYLVKLRLHSDQTTKNKHGVKHLHKESLELIKDARKFIKRKPYYKASIGWTFHHNFVLCINSLGEFQKLKPLILGLFNLEGLFEYIKLMIIYKIIKNPEYLYIPPIKFIKIN